MIVTVQVSNIFLRGALDARYSKCGKIGQMKSRTASSLASPKIGLRSIFLSIGVLSRRDLEAFPADSPTAVVWEAWGVLLWSALPARSHHGHGIEQSTITR
jgi:hypothetical protein